MSIDGSITIPYQTLAGVLEPGSLTTGDSYLPDLNMDTGGSIEPPLPLPQIDLIADGLAGNVADGALLLSPLATVGAGVADAMLPTWALAATGTAAALIDGDVTLLAYALAGSLEPALPLPLYDLAGTALAGNVADADLTLPLMAVAASVGTTGDVLLPTWDAMGAGVAGNVANGALLLSVWDSSASAYQDTTATGDVTFALLGVTADMVSTALIHGDVTLPLASLAGAGVAGNVAMATLTLPLWQAGADGYYDNIGAASIELPALLASGLLHNTSAAPVAGTTINLNTRVKAVTLYEGFSANSYARFAGMTLAATANGIVALAGDTDLGTPIAARLRSGITDFDAEELKRVLTGYVGYRADGDMELTLITDEHHEFIYALQPRQAGGDIHPSRVKFGRGISGRYWQWALNNRDGAGFNIDSLTLVVEPRKRRI